MNKQIKYKFFSIIAIFCLMILPLTSCDSSADKHTTDRNYLSADSDSNYKESEGIKITLTGNSAQCDSNAVFVSASTVTI